MAYCLQTTEQLKALLRAKGATTRGRKADLIDRIEAYDRNENFTDAEIVLPMPVPLGPWPTCGFEALTHSHRQRMPELSIAAVEAYFKYRIAADNEEMGDFKALEKGKRLLQSNCILACSMLIEHNFFFSGLVSAAMKKGVSYAFKIKLSPNGDIINTDCECPAGKGPHGTCKHLAAVLLVIEDFQATGNLNVRKSCTDRLQTFHKPSKEYSGSPKKAEHLHGGLKRSHNFEDPRPQRFRNTVGYLDHVRNTTFNFCSASGKDLNMRYLFGRANMAAAMQDHHYLALPYPEYWVDHAAKVDALQAMELEKKTRGQSKSKVWLEERHWRLTASHFGSVCKATMRRNRSKLCQSIISQKRLFAKSIRHGVENEGRAITKLEAKCNVMVRKCGMFVDPALSYLAATPDGVVDEKTIVEVKCPYSGRYDTIAPGKHFSYLCYVNGELELKKESAYYMQIQGQMYISKRKYCLFGVFTFCDFFIQKIALDEEYCIGSLIPKLSLFYKNHLRPHIAAHCIC